MVTGVHPGAGYHLQDNESNGRIRHGVVDDIEIIQLNLPYSNYDSIFKRAWIFLQFAMVSIRLALRLDYDLLFATSTPLTAALPGIMTKWFRKKPFVFEVRDLWPELPKAMGVIKNRIVLLGLRILERLAYRCADGVVALSPGIAESIEPQLRTGVSVSLIPNAADTELFESGCRDTVPKGELVAVFTGAHGLANGLEALLDAAKVLLDRNRADIRLHLIGDGKLKPSLVKRAADEGLSNCIFEDPIPKHALAARLQEVDVGLMLLANVPAFYRGTSPNKFFDYLAAGLPVVNNYPGWLAELIHSNKCGLAVEPDDPQALANALIWLADNPAARLGMGERSRELAEGIFSRDRLGTEFVEFLEFVYEHAR